LLHKQYEALKIELESERKALKIEQRARIELEWKVKELLARLFKPGSEKISPDQLQLLLEGFEQDAAMSAPGSAGEEAPEFTEEVAVKKTHPSKRTVFPADLPERIIEIDLPEDERICPVTGAVRAFIRWEETIKINFVPGYFERLIIRRAVRAVKMPADAAGNLLPESPVITAEMPAEYRVIPGAIAAAGLLAWLIVSKYCDHLPFYRQQQIFKRQHQVNIDRNMMCHWMKRCCVVLGILYEAMRTELLSGNYLQIDETFIKLLDPDTKGKAKQSHFWVIRRPPEPSGGGGGVLFHFDPGRNHEVALELLGDYRGSLQCDGYKVYPVIDRKTGRVTLFFCWAHVRRKFVESLEFGGPAAAWYVAEIQRLYRVENQARESGLDASGRERLREELSRPVLTRIKERLDRDRGDELFLPSSPLGKAINYTLERWSGLERYAESGWGHIEIDNNGIENAIRPTAVGKKNWLFIGHPKAGQRSAILYTIIENCRLCGINPLKYLCDVMPKIMDHPAGRVSELLPRQWKAARDASAEETAHVMAA